MRTVQEVIEFVSFQMQNTNAGYKTKLLTFVRTAWDNIRTMHDWKWFYRDGFMFRVVATYSTGEVAIANGSADVTGTDTTWTSSMVGRKFRIVGDESEYTIIKFTSTTSITIDRTFTGDTVTEKGYDIYQPTYFMSGDFQRIYHIRQESSGGNLDEVSERDFYRNHPDPMAVGIPDEYFLQRVPIGGVWLTIGKLSFAASGSDSGKTIKVRGISNGAEVEESIVLAAGSAISSTNSYSHIVKISKEPTANAVTVTLPDGDGDATGDTFVISPETTDAHFWKITVWPYPQDAIDIYGNYKHNPYPVYQLDDTIPDELDMAVQYAVWSFALSEDEQSREAKDKMFEFERVVARVIGMPVKFEHVRPRLILNPKAMYDRRTYT